MVQQNPQRQNQVMRIASAAIVLFVTTCAVVVVFVICRPGVSQACKVDRRAARAADASGQPRVIILLIGDGMGEAQRTAARWQAVGQSGQLAMDAMPVSGWSCTGSANNSVTDSAAAATALATGVKTNNGMISIDPYSNTLTTILEQAQARGMAVGLVTTVQMAHATPAAFASHVYSRSMMTEIASQMMGHHVDVLLGGGEDEFLPDTETGCYPQAGERTDGRNLVGEAVAVGYTYVCTPMAFAAVPVTTTHLLGLFADEGMTRPFSPTLAQMTQKSIDILSQDPEGFFLMVEGGQIDWACHDNDAANAISDTIGFDEAVAVAQDYASLNPNTLVIVTGDHETGGMSVSLSYGEDGPFYMPDGTPFYVNWTTGGHTSADVPTTAQGVFSNLLEGTDENTLIYDVMYELVEPDIWLPLVLRGGKE
jgi:alkaline phosphatase